MYKAQNIKPEQLETPLCKILLQIISSTNSSHASPRNNSYQYGIITTSTCSAKRYLGANTTANEVPLLRISSPDS